MDAPGGEIQGKIPGLGLSPLQKPGAGVVKGVVGGAVILPPAGIPQDAPAAHLLRRPVKYHRGVLRLLRSGAPEEAVVQVPQGGGGLGQAIRPGRLFRLGPFFLRRQTQPGQRQQGQNSARKQLNHPIKRLLCPEQQSTAPANGPECPDTHRDRGETHPGQSGAGKAQHRHGRQVRLIPQQTQAQPHGGPPGSPPGRFHLPDAAHQKSARQAHSNRYSDNSESPRRKAQPRRQQQGQPVPAAQQQVRDRGGEAHAEHAQGPQPDGPGDEIRRLHQKQQRRRKTRPEKPPGEKFRVEKGDAAGEDQNGRRQLPQARLKRQKQKRPQSAAQHAAQARQSRPSRRRDGQRQRGAQAPEGAGRQQAGQGRPAQGFKQPPFLPGQWQKFHGQALLCPLL